MTRFFEHIPRDKCGFRWNAPKVMSDHTVESVPQVCAEPKNHKDDHRSVGKVTAPNKEGKT